MSVKTYEGDLRAPEGARFAIVACRFNHLVVDRLLEGALDALKRAGGVSDDRIVLAWVPGAFELPLTVKRLAASGQFAAVIALGAVIRGSTPHFDFVAGQAASGASAAMLATGVPVAFGVITTEDIEQAVERAGTKAGNKGFEAAMTALEMASLGTALTRDGL
ncbi:MAG: 6,7-dimethyl-8-ribityllumazine synthase [Sandaracinaceae bacterium]|nr:6,7-dimethyl-8-ribityllumazine synthase [Sandaracinaceae bacterium]